MATTRVVSTNFWRDSYIVDLDPTEKLLFLYFLTNPSTTLAGIYEISIRQVAFDTGIDKDMIIKILDRFQRDQKMYFEKNWLVLNNFIKHQRPNPSIIKGIEKAISELPTWLQEKIAVEKSEDDQLSIFTPVEEQSGDSLGTVSPQYNLIKSNLNKIKLNKSKPNKAADKPQQDFDKKGYAKAAEADRDLAKREAAARTRTGSGYDSFQEIGKKIKSKKEM